MKLIEGVKIKELRTIPDERGYLMEMLRCDDEIFKRFGQVYLTVVHPGVGTITRNRMTFSFR